MAPVENPGLSHGAVATALASNLAEETLRLNAALNVSELSFKHALQEAERRKVELEGEVAYLHDLVLTLLEGSPVGAEETSSCRQEGARLKAETRRLLSTSLHLCKSVPPAVSAPTTAGSLATQTVGSLATQADGEDWKKERAGHLKEVQRLAAEKSDIEAERSYHATAHKRLASELLRAKDQSKVLETAEAVAQANLQQTMEDLRKKTEECDQLILERKEAIDERDRLAAELAKSGRVHEELALLGSHTKAELQSKAKEIGELRRETENLRSQNDELERLRRDALQDLQARREENRALQDKADKLFGDHQSASQELEQVKEELEQVKDEHRRVAQRNAELLEEHAQMKEDQSVKNEKLLADLQSAAQEVEKVNNANERLTQQNEKLIAEALTAAQEIALLRDEVQQLREGATGMEAQDDTAAERDRLLEEVQRVTSERQQDRERLETKARLATLATEDHLERLAETSQENADLLKANANLRHEKELVDTERQQLLGERDRLTVELSEVRRRSVEMEKLLVSREGFDRQESPGGLSAGSSPMGSSPALGRVSVPSTSSSMPQMISISALRSGSLSSVPRLSEPRLSELVPTEEVPFGMEEEQGGDPISPNALAAAAAAATAAKAAAAARAAEEAGQEEDPGPCQQETDVDLDVTAAVLPPSVQDLQEVDLEGRAAPPLRPPVSVTDITVSVLPVPAAEPEPAAEPASEPPPKAEEAAPKTPERPAGGRFSSNAKGKRLLFQALKSGAAGKLLDEFEAANANKAASPEEASAAASSPRTATPVTPATLPPATPLAERVERGPEEVRLAEEAAKCYVETIIATALRNKAEEEERQLLQPTLGSSLSAASPSPTREAVPIATFGTDSPVFGPDEQDSAPLGQSAEMESGSDGLGSPDSNANQMRGDQMMFFASRPTIGATMSLDSAIRRRRLISDDDDDGEEIEYDEIRSGSGGWRTCGALPNLPWRRHSSVDLSRDTKPTNFKSGGKYSTFSLGDRPEDGDMDDGEDATSVMHNLSMPVMHNTSYDGLPGHNYRRNSVGVDPTARGERLSSLSLDDSLGCLGRPSLDGSLSVLPAKLQALREMRREREPVPGGRMLVERLFVVASEKMGQPCLQSRWPKQENAEQQDWLEEAIVTKGFCPGVEAFNSNVYGSEPFIFSLLETALDPHGDPGNMIYGCVCGDPYDAEQASPTPVTPKSVPAVGSSRSLGGTSPTSSTSSAVFSAGKALLQHAQRAMPYPGKKPTKTKEGRSASLTPRGITSGPLSSTRSEGQLTPPVQGSPRRGAVYCLVSRVPLFAFFFEILDLIRGNPECAGELLERINNRGFCDELVSEGVNLSDLNLLDGGTHLRLQLPRPLLCDWWSLSLSNSISPWSPVSRTAARWQVAWGLGVLMSRWDNLVGDTLSRLLACTLLEQKVLLLGEVPRAGAVAMVLRGLLWPFRWLHLFLSAPPPDELLQVPMLEGTFPLVICVTELPRQWGFRTPYELPPEVVAGILRHDYVHVSPHLETVGGLRNTALKLPEGRHAVLLKQVAQAKQKLRKGEIDTQSATELIQEAAEAEVWRLAKMVKEYAAAQVEEAKRWQDAGDFSQKKLQDRCVETAMQAASFISWMRQAKIASCTEEALPFYRTFFNTQLCMDLLYEEIVAQVRVTPSISQYTSEEPRWSAQSAQQ